MIQGIGVLELKKVFFAWANIMRENRDYLVRLDGVAGDSDLGLTMADGFGAAAAFSEQYDGSDVGMMLYRAGKAIMDKAPSSLGTLIGGGFLDAGKALKGTERLEWAQAYRIFEVIEASIMNRGKAKPGEKTFLDGLDPAVAVLRGAAAGDDYKALLESAAKAAQQGSVKTKEMVAKHGRIAIRGRESIGILDPGSVVAALMIRAFADALGMDL